MRYSKEHHARANQHSHQRGDGPGKIQWAQEKCGASQHRNKQDADDNEIRHDFVLRRGPARGTARSRKIPIQIKAKRWLATEYISFEKLGRASELGHLKCH